MNHTHPHFVHSLLVGAACLGMVTLSTGPAFAQDTVTVTGKTAETSATELLDVPLEDLLTIESTSVAKKRQRVSDSAAAVYVITQEDIQRSAATTIPDLLRGVPGVEVAQQTNASYAVSIRGFNSRFANSILVMIDGRSQFVSTFSVVFWDQLMIPLDEIERIEVVRGPGAALWGANTSNGVINIITKHSADSGGTLIDVHAGAREQAGSLSHGGRISENLTYRVHGSFRRDGGLVDETGTDIDKRWQGKSGGARIDWEPDDRNAYTLQGEYSDARYDTQFRLPDSNLLNPGYDFIHSDNRFNSVNALARWTHRHSDTLDWSAQAQYNRVERTEFVSAHLVWQLADIDIGLHWRASNIHDISVGVGARLLDDHIRGPSYFYFDDPSATDRWISGYFQDDITIVPDTLRLTVGTKVEYNNFTGFEFQPSARIFFRPTPLLSFWGAITRAVRTPSRFERSAHMAFNVDLPGTPSNPYPLPIYTTLNGVADRQSERLTAFEAGARANLGGNWSIDVSGYYNRYSDLTVATPGAIVPLFVSPITFPVGLQADINFVGTGKARTWGVEATLAGNITPWWKATLNYSYFDFKVADDAITGIAPTLLFPLEASPRHQLALRNNFDFTDNISLDTQLRHISRLDAGSVPAYTALDLRLTYRLSNGIELSLAGKNLLDARHLEYYQQQYPAPLAYVPRSVAGQLRYRF